MVIIGEVITVTDVTEKSSNGRSLIKREFWPRTRTVHFGLRSFHNLHMKLQWGTSNWTWLRLESNNASRYYPELPKSRPPCTTCESYREREKESDGASTRRQTVWSCKDHINRTMQPTEEEERSGGANLSLSLSPSLGWLVTVRCLCPQTLTRTQSQGKEDTASIPEKCSSYMQHSGVRITYWDICWLCHFI